MPTRCCPALRYADDALGVLLGKLDDLGVLDDTAVLVSSDLASTKPASVATARTMLEERTATQLARSPGHDDPMDTVRREGGPFHVRRHLPAYLERLRATGRSHWADILTDRHPTEL